MLLRQHRGGGRPTPGISGERCLFSSQWARNRYCDQVFLHQRRFIMLNRLGDDEARLTRIFAIHTGDRTNEHNRHPNWNPNAATPETTFELVLEAEAGETIGALGTQGYEITIWGTDLRTSAA